MQQDPAARLRALAASDPARVERVHIADLRALADLLGPRSQAAALVSHAERLVNPHVYRLRLRREWIVVFDAVPDDTVVIRRWW